MSDRRQSLGHILNRLSLERPTTLGRSQSLTSFLEERQWFWPEDANSFFLPVNCLDHLLTPINIELELRRIYRDRSESWTRQCASLICRQAPKIFIILLCLAWENGVSYIDKFVNEGITDHDLPFTREYQDHSSGHYGRYWLCRKNHHSCPKSRHQDCAIGALSSWSKNQIIEFETAQWRILAPEFRQIPHQIEHQKLNVCTIMPYIEDNERFGGQIKAGGYAQVWSVRIHPAHQTLYQSRNSHGVPPLLAVKRPYTDDPKEFKEERVMLDAVAIRNHDHLIKLLATYQLGERCHFLFPFADANLRDFWKSIGKPYWNRETYVWALRQMNGLASGLNAIHNYETTEAQERVEADPKFARGLTGGHFTVQKGEAKFGRHGDLKPENILWFNGFRNGDTGGILQITDLGLGRFHGLESRSKVNPKSINGSPTYTPPEIMLNENVSRAYDIWSLGCVYLEFVTWLVEGDKGIHDFAAERDRKADDGIYDDMFFTLIENGYGGAELRQGVKSWCSRLQQKTRCSPMLVEILKLIQNEMLVIDSKERIRSERLCAELERIMRRAESDTKYLLGEAPNRDRGMGIKMPPNNG